MTEAETIDALKASRRLKLLRRLDVAGLLLTVVGLLAALIWAFPLYAAILGTVALPSAAGPACTCTCRSP